MIAPNPADKDCLAEPMGPCNIRLQDVQIDIINVMGQRVATLVSGHRDAGRHIFSFDASAPASGIYISRLRVGREVHPKCMTLCK